MGRHSRPLAARRARVAGMFDHVSIGVSDLRRAGAFYDAVLAALGFVRLHENHRSACYGPVGFTGEAPFAIIAMETAIAPEPGLHIAFTATSRLQVDAFYDAALRHGGTDDGPPGIRENYDPGYYAAFVLDPDGHRLEAVVHEAA